MIKDVKFAVTCSDQDKTSLRVDKEGVHRGGEHPQTVGGAGESSRSSNGQNRGLFFSIFSCYIQRKYRGPLSSIHSRHFLACFCYSFFAVHKFLCSKDLLKALKPAMAPMRVVGCCYN